MESPTTLTVIEEHSIGQGRNVEEVAPGTVVVEPDPQPDARRLCTVYSPTWEFRLGKTEDLSVPRGLHGGTLNGRILDNPTRES